MNIRLEPPLTTRCPWLAILPLALLNSASPARRGKTCCFGIALSCAAAGALFFKPRFRPGKRPTAEIRQGGFKTAGPGRCGCCVVESRPDLRVTGGRVVLAACRDLAGKETSPASRPAVLWPCWRHGRRSRCGESRPERRPFA